MKSEHASAIGAVLAGGRSSRLGSPKATAALHGRPLIGYPLAAFGAAGIDVAVVAKRSTPLPPLDVPLWNEPEEPVHPLRGIVTALERAGGRPVVVCGCDMPCVSPDLLMALANRCEPLVVPLSGGRLHPLLARYAKELIEPLTAALESERALHAIVRELEPAVMDQRELSAFGDPARLLFNVNTPAELERARALVSECGA